MRTNCVIYYWQSVNIRYCINYWRNGIWRQGIRSNRRNLIHGSLPSCHPYSSPPTILASSAWSWYNHQATLKTGFYQPQLVLTKGPLKPSEHHGSMESKWLPSVWSHCVDMPEPPKRYMVDKNCRLGPRPIFAIYLLALVFRTFLSRMC